MTKPQLSPAQKEAISKKLMEAYAASGFPSRAKYATSIGITSSDFSNIQNATWKKNDKLIGVQKWLRIAHKVGFEWTAGQRWQTAPTLTYRAISKQLEVCKEEGMAAIFCDEAGIGKTHTAKEFCATHPNAFYVQGGSYPRKVGFVRALAQAVGLNPDKSTVEELIEDIVQYLKAVERPVIVVDEAGDLHNNVYLLLKRLYNELEFVCGFYLIGAGGLKKRIDSAVRLHTNGFEEVFSRFGGRFNTVLPQGAKERKEFMREEAILVAHTNALTDEQKLSRILSREFDLRTIRREVIKQRQAA